MQSSSVQRIALFIAVLAGFLTPFDLSGVNIALPQMGAEFSMGAIELGWVPTAYLLASAVFLVPFGRIADLYGRKKVFLTGLSLFTLASFLLVFSVSALMIILLRILQGMGSALIFGTAVAILTSVTPPGERGKALGIYITAVYLGLTFGPFFGGFLTQHFGWRSIFLVNIPLGIFTIGLILAKLKGEWAEARGEGFDLAGALLYGLTLIAVILGFSRLPSWTGGAFLLGGLFLLCLFLFWESRSRVPLLDLQLIRNNRPFAFSNLAALINYSATFAITFFLSLYLQYILGFRPDTAGLILITQPLIQAIFSSSAGRLSDRIEPGKVASVGMALNALGLFLLSFLGATTPLTLLIPALVVMGVGFALFSSPNTNAVMSSVDRKCYGIASGMLGTMRLVGQMLSMGIAMMLFALYIGAGVSITPPLYPSFLTSLKTGFLVFSGLCAVGVVASLVRGTVREEAKGACTLPHGPK